MAPSTSQRSRNAWQLIAKQHGVIARRQLIALGFSQESIRHRLDRGRLHQIWRGVYATGRPDLTREGQLMAAVLTCGPFAALSGESAGELHSVRTQRPGPIEITVYDGDRRGQPGIKVRRRALRDRDLTNHRGIPVTTPIRTLIDLSVRLRSTELERAVNEADRLELIDPERLRRSLAGYRGVPGVAKLRKLLDLQFFTLTDSVLEQRFLPIARRAGLPRPLTGQRVNGFRVDFYWPDLGLVVETDGLRYHRTPAQQARDNLRDQAHTVAGLTPMRFSHAQIYFDARGVQDALIAVAKRLRP